MSRNQTNLRNLSDNRTKHSSNSSYLLQNQNQILQLKNKELQQTIATMKSQLIATHTALATDEDQCEGLRAQIKRTEITEDLLLQQQKISIEQRNHHMLANTQITCGKIADVREATQTEKNKIPIICEEKKMLERTLWENKTENQGTRVILDNLEKELQKYRQENAQLMSKKKVYGPKQSQISRLIEQRLRIIKNMENQGSKVCREEGAHLLAIAVKSIEYRKKKENLIAIEQYGYRKQGLKKRMLHLSLIRRKYLIFVKNAIMQKFRQKFRPLQEEYQFRTILENTRKRRIKNTMLRIWRSQTSKRDYIKLRYFEAQATIQKFSVSYQNTVLFSVFNTLKYLFTNPLHRRSAATIYKLFTTGLKRSQTMFLSSLINLQNKHVLNVELEESAKEQSLLLVMSIYFVNWAKLTKDHKVSNRFIKFKYFRELKKLLVLRKKRDLSEMLLLARQKIHEIDITSAAFCHIKKEKTYGLLDSLGQQKQNSKNRSAQLQSKIGKYIGENKESMGMFGVLKLVRTLKKKVQKAFNVWRCQNRKYRKLELVMNLIHHKMSTDINFGFVMIQRRKFEKLKNSISDKIQSCEFSYNYLVQENAHIKEVLDSKLLDLEKTKFAGILRKIIKAEKQIKHKYFYKFLKSGYKYWKFQRNVVRIDTLIENKIKRVFMFLLKEINNQKIIQDKIENTINFMQAKRSLSIYSQVFGIFSNVAQRNQKLRRIMGNIFARNLELGVYNSYNKIKKIATNAKEQEVLVISVGVEENIKSANSHTTKTEDTIEILRERLKNKQESIKNRIILSCRKIYIRNSANKYMEYFNRWRNKLSYEKRVGRFVQIMQRKTRILLKNKLINNIIKKKGDQEVSELKQRLDKYNKELEEETLIFDSFAQDSQNKMKTMLEQNQSHESEAKMLQKRTDRMDDIKIESFRRYWQKMICKFVFRDWKIQKKQFMEKWNKVFALLQSFSRKETFMTISQEMRAQIMRNRIKINLSYIYAKKFRHNAGVGFRIWRLVNLNTRIKEGKVAFDQEVINHKQITGKYDKIIYAYDTSVNSRIGERKVRMIFDFLKKYTRLKIDNNRRKIRLETWLKRGYQSNFITLLISYTKPIIQNNKKADNLFQSVPSKLAKVFVDKLSDIVARKKIINKLFINKFIHYSLLKVYEEFFTMTKKYYRWVQVKKKNDQTMQIQKVIELFDKKRKDIMCQNMRKWRKNQYIINIEQTMFRRLTRKAMYNRYEGMFYAWKLESEAKKVLKYHHEEGEVKKRKVEISRIEKFLHDFKKEKGLLLENQEGNFVSSPRFQKKKQEEEKKDKNLRYKFISRAIMSTNGYSVPIKAYNNLQMYMKLRERYKEKAQFVVNHLRRPDILLAFKVWRKATTKFKEDFENLERKQLIKVLNRQKDKMEMSYSEKLSVDEQIEQQISRYKLYSHQRQRKQKLCAHVFLRHANKTKGYAFEVWRKRMMELRERDNSQLAGKGAMKLQDLEQEIREMQEIEQALIENNNRLREAVTEAAEIAEMVRRISEERDKLSHLILEKNLNCESLAEENAMLNSKLYMAQKQAIQLLILSGQRP